MKIDVDPTLLAEKQTLTDLDELDHIGEMALKLRDHLQSGNRLAEGVLHSMRLSVEHHWEAGQLVKEIKAELLKGKTSKGNARKRPIGIEAVCVKFQITYEWARQAEKVRERFPTKEDIPPVPNVTELKRLIGILSPPKEKPVTDPVGTTPTSKPTPAKSEVDEDGDKAAPTENPQTENRRIENRKTENPTSVLDDETDDSQENEDPAIWCALERIEKAVVDFNEAFENESAFITIHGVLAERIDTVLVRLMHVRDILLAQHDMP